MFDAFPYDAWGPEVADFWAFGGANSTGTYIMTALGADPDVRVADRLRPPGDPETRTSRPARLRKDGMLARMRPSPTPTSE